MDKSAGGVDLSEGELKDAVTNASVTNIATVVQLKAKVAKLRDRARIRIKSLRDFHSAIEKNDLVAVKALLDSTVLEKRFLLNEVDVRDSQRLASLHRAAKLPDHHICSSSLGRRIFGRPYMRRGHSAPFGSSEWQLGNLPRPYLQRC